MDRFLLALTSATDTESASGLPMQDTLVMIGLFVVVMGVMYFLTIRPQKKREKELKKQIDSMAVGDKIVTIGGVVGIIANIQEENVTITTSVANTMITFRKTAVSTITKREDINK